MQAEQEVIEIASIDFTDQRYFFTDQNDIDTLSESVGRVGLITPPILQIREEGGLRVVAGFRRTSACKRLNFEQIPARMIPAEADSLYCLQIAVADNTSARQLNLGEQCGLVEKFYGLCGSKEAVSEALGQIGYCMPADLIEKLLRVSTLPEAVGKGVAGNYISLNTALEMESIPSTSSVAVAGIFKMLRPTVNQQKEILAGLKELAGRQEVSIESLLKTREFSDILDSADTDRGLCLRLLRSEIYKRRYPALSRAETEFHRRKKNLGMDENMDLKPPPNFEDTIYTLIVRFSSARQLCANAETLAGICRHPALEAILKREIEDPQNIY